VSDEDNEEIDALLSEALSKVSVSFDRGRDGTKPCTFCGKSDEPRVLMTIGRYMNNGALLTRPVCPSCAKIGEIRSQPPPPVEIDLDQEVRVWKNAGGSWNLSVAGACVLSETTWDDACYRAENMKGCLADLIRRVTGKRT
jgi:hypothetical protein